MSRQAAKDAIVKLIVGAGQASPSPPVGPALGSKGVKSMDFCKEFNALTAGYLPGTPIPALITVRPDRTFSFTLRTPPTSTLLLLAAGVTPTKAGKTRGANAPGRVPEPSVGDTSPTHVKASGSKNMALSAGGGVGLGTVKMVAKTAGGDKAPGHGGGTAQVGEVSLKHIYEIALIKQSEARLSGVSLEGMCKSVIAQARSLGVGVVV